MKSWRLIFPLALLSALPAGGQQGFAPAGPAMDWLSRYRAGHSRAPLATEPALERAAAAYAAVLAASGRLAHRDGEERRALARYRSAGGTAVRVGEILGAGPALEAVTAAWEASPAHAAAALDSRWTHAGAGSAPLGPAPGPGTAPEARVWVVLFAEQRVEDLKITADQAGYRVAGRLPEREAGPPVLLSGLARIAPEAWDPASGQFAFHLPRKAGGLYHRLGCRLPAGGFVLAAAFFPATAAERRQEPAAAGPPGPSGSSRSPVRPFQRFAVEFLHLQQGLHDPPGFLRIRVAHQLSDDARDDLPRKAVLVFQPAALFRIGVRGELPR
jgi:hypothetical protein